MNRGHVELVRDLRHLRDRMERHGGCEGRAFAEALDEVLELDRKRREVRRYEEAYVGLVGRLRTGLRRIRSGGL